MERRAKWVERRTEAGGTADRSGWNGGPKWVERRTSKVKRRTSKVNGGLAGLDQKPSWALRRARRVAVRSVMPVLMWALQLGFTILETRALKSAAAAEKARLDGNESIGNQTTTMAQAIRAVCSACVQCNRAGAPLFRCFYLS